MDLSCIGPKNAAPDMGGLGLGLGKGLASFWQSYLAFLFFDAEQWLAPSSESFVFTLGNSSFFMVDLDIDTS